jgi:hypothetical protein
MHSSPPPRRLRTQTPGPGPTGGGRQTPRRTVSCRANERAKTRTALAGFAAALATLGAKRELADGRGSSAYQITADAGAALFCGG